MLNLKLGDRVKLKNDEEGYVVAIDNKLCTNIKYAVFIDVQKKSRRDFTYSKFLKRFEHYESITILPFPEMPNVRWVGNDEICSPKVEYDDIAICFRDNKTIAIAYKDYNEVDRAEARCAPEDEFDYYIGARLALDRLFGREDFLLQFVK